MSTKIATVFLDRVKRSGLLVGDKLSQIRQDLESEGVDLSDANAIATALVKMGVLTKWQTEKLLQGKHKGFFLGSYRLLKPLGRGGMGAVFLAEHEMMRRQCAIKVLPHTQIKEGSSVLQRFYVEAQAVASLDHQNIVRAYDVAKETKDGKDIHYLVMEYVEGQDAQVMVQSHGPTDLVKAAELLRQTANGLAHAHENGLIHRDIKPANLLVDNKGVIKILDLGLARFFDDSEAASLTAAHNETVLGTADYLSPEQALNSHNVDHRTDIYSLGCTAYFLLTGHPPFPDGSVAERLLAHQVRTPTPLSEERPDAPAGLVAMIDKMMAKKAEDRFASADDVASALAAWLIDNGGEDWRRQHSEISADSSLLKLLTRSHEPTRAISSAHSATELELAPLDDDGDIVASPSGSSLSESKSGPSSSALEPDLGLADVDDGAAAEIDAASLPPLESDVSETLAADEQPASIDLDSLPDLDQPADLGSLGEDELLAELPVTPLENLADLEGLAHEDPLGKPTGTSSGSMAAIDSHIRSTTSHGSSSGIRRGDSSKSLEKPKAGHSAFSIARPIVIGVVGGLLLVGIVIGLITMGPNGGGVKSSSPVTPPTELANATETEQDPASPDHESQQERPDQPPAPVAADELKGDAAESSGYGAERKTERPKQDLGGSEAKPNERPGTGETGDGGAGQHVTLPTEQGPSVKRKIALDVVEPPVEEEPGEGVLAVADPRTDAPVTTDAPQTSQAEVAPALQVDAQTKQALFAQIKKVGGVMKVQGEPVSQKTPKQIQPLVQYIALSLRNAVEGANLIVQENSNAVMDLDLTWQQEGDLTYCKLVAQLIYTMEDGNPVTLWENSVDLQKFRGSPTTSVFDLWKREINKSFRGFEDAHSKAKRSARQR